METLTPKEYAEENGGLRCPLCGSENLEGSNIQVDAGIAWQNIICEDCEANWSDIYKLIGYSNLVEKG